MASGKIPQTSNVNNVYSKQITVSANSFLSEIVDVSLSGYTPIAVVGFDTGGSEVFFYRARLDGNNLYYAVRNTVADQVTTTIRVIVSYQKK